MKMKVVQCWDDGINNDVRLTELLRKHHAKATFNLNPGLMGGKTVSEWIRPGDRRWSFHGFRDGKIALRDIGEVYQGFQLASHCWKHENAGMVSDEAWIKSALDARHFLEDIVQKDCRGFAWPCGVATSETGRLLRENGFAYGRLTGDSMDISRCEDVMALTPSCHYQSSFFWEYYEAAKKNQLPVFYFWGHSYEMFNYEPLWRQLEDKLRFIDEDPDAEWADVTEIAALIDKK